MIRAAGAPQRVRVGARQPEGAPEPAARAPMTPGWVPAAAWAILAVGLGYLAVRYWQNPPYTPDSWAYYELSRHVGPDFFRIDTYRSYQSATPYSVSFPPLWPLVIATVDTVTRTGARAGIVAAFGCVGATAGVLEVFGRRFVGRRGAGPLVAVGLLAFPPYADEAVAARSFPLCLLLLSLLLWSLLRIGEGSRWAAVPAGALAAGLILTRSDTLLALVLLGSALLATRRVRWPQAVIAGAVCTIALLPWAFYGLAHFGTPLVADNTIIASAVRTHFVLDVLDPGKVPTLLDNPWQWLLRVCGNAPAVLWSWLTALAKSPTVLLAAALAWLSWRARSATARSATARSAGGRPAWLSLAMLALVAFTAQTALAELTTGYAQERYISFLILAIVVAAGGLILSGEVPPRLPARGVRALVALVLVVLPPLAVVGYHTLRPSGVDTLTGGQAERELQLCRDGDSTLLMDLAPRHGALTGKPTALLPSNLAELSVAERRRWVIDYHIGQFYEMPQALGFGKTGIADDVKVRSLLSAAVTLTPDPCVRIGRLYRVSVPTS
jgi:hypothetical protein